MLFTVNAHTISGFDSLTDKLASNQHLYQSTLSSLTFPLYRYYPSVLPDGDKPNSSGYQTEDNCPEDFFRHFVWKV